MNGADKCFLVGNITQEPKLVQTKDGRIALFINIAVNHEKKNDDGTRSSNTTFIPVSVFGTRAEGLSQLLEKGSNVFVLAHHAVYDKIKLSIVADDVQIITGKRNNTAAQMPQQIDFNDE